MLACDMRRLVTGVPEPSSPPGVSLVGRDGLDLADCVPFSEISGASVHEGGAPVIGGMPMPVPTPKPMPTPVSLPRCPAVLAFGAPSDALA